MKRFKFFPILIVFTLLMSGCVYNFILPEEVNEIDPDDPDAPEISFALEILPIFTTNNNCTACHKTGLTSPDLTSDNAYAAISTTKYINVTNPEESKIYKVPHPDQDGHTQKKYSQAQAARILLWIQQGAKNN